MRSGEIAKLAGVTVRTLRHYRAVGLLSEPPRSENGYADYRAIDLIRLLRIKHLATLGFSLSTIGEMLESPDQVAGGSAQTRLDELDRELVTRIEELEGQRRTIALLKQGNLDVDLPPNTAQHIRLMRTNGIAEEFIDGERESLLLASGFLKDSNLLAEFYQVAGEQGLMGQYGTLSKRIYELPDDAPEDVRDTLANEYAMLLKPLLQAIDLKGGDTYEETLAESLVLNHELATLNDAQKDTVSRLFRNLASAFPLLKDAEERFQAYI